MDLVKLGKKGQVTIPKAILKQAESPRMRPLLIATTPDGSIVLRQAGVCPIEIYTDERIAQLARLEKYRDPPDGHRRRAVVVLAERIGVNEIRR